MDVQMNNLDGPVPKSIGNCKNLTMINLTHNQIYGLLPREIGDLLDLQVLKVLSNNLHGYLPPELSSCNKLYLLDLAFNSLNGSILSSWADLTFLSQLTERESVQWGHSHFLIKVPSSFWSLHQGHFWAILVFVSCQVNDTSCKHINVLKLCDETVHPEHISIVAVVIIVLGSLLSVILVSFLLHFVLQICKRTRTEEDIFLHEGSSHLLTMVMEATENLNDRYVVGRGAHGIACSTGKIYALKKLDFRGQNGPSASMVREIRTIGKIRHRNLVKLEDFWSRSEYGLILYEYMENGSLYDFLHERKSAPALEWNVRYRIALGTAQGLAYFHNDCKPTILHRDIKSKNILLDSELEPHISDFVLAKYMDQNSGTQSSTIMGTIGYIYLQRWHIQQEEVRNQMSTAMELSCSS